MNLSGVLLSRRRPADNRSDSYKGRLRSFGLSSLDCAVKLGNVLDIGTSFLPVHSLDVPSISAVAIF